MTSRDPKGAVRQYGRLSQRQLGFLSNFGSGQVKVNVKSLKYRFVGLVSSFHELDLQNVYSLMVIMHKTLMIDLVTYVQITNIWHYCSYLSRSQAPST